MLGLRAIQPLVQETAEAIAFVLNAELEIIDNKQNILSSSSREKSGITTDISFKKYNGLCSKITLKGVMLGEIRLKSYTLSNKQDEQMVTKYLNHMSSLLAAKVAETEALKRVWELEAILETIHEGTLVIDDEGVVTYCNSTAQQLLKMDKKDILGHHLAHFWPEPPALDTLKTGREYTEKEEIIQHGRGLMHFIVTVRLIKDIRGGKGAVISFRDIAEARRLIYDISENRAMYTFDDIIGCSSAVEQIKEQALRVAAGNSTVLITGETGTGKEVFARAIHFASPRAQGPFININCGAIPENLLESELFGYDRGAFTGALKEGKAGKFELADGGTIFLDEIGEMPLNLQVKLLHVLQNREVERVGGTKKIPVDIRIIAASNRDLEKMMYERKFRKDLYFRLGVIPLHIPPLRERKEDIPLLVQYCLEKYIKKLNKPSFIISSEVMEYFMQYRWPGNVREMENAVEYAINMCNGTTITVNDLPPRITNTTEEDFEYTSTLESLLNAYEQKILKEYLRQFGTSSRAKKRIAQALGISRATLYRKLSNLEVSED